MPEWVLEIVSRHAIDFYAMSEDLPLPNSRVRVEGDKIFLDWQRTNWDSHMKLREPAQGVLRRAGFPLVLSQPFDRRTPSHQCGTVRMGSDPAKPRRSIHSAALMITATSSWSMRASCRASAAVNPALTIAAQALRVADHIAKTDLGVRGDAIPVRTVQ